MKDMKKKYYEPYAGIHPRKRQEMEDYGMIKEDHSATANLPQEVMMKRYKVPYYDNMRMLDDTISGIDYQIERDVRKMSEYEQPDKY